MKTSKVILLTVLVISFITISCKGRNPDPPTPFLKAPSNVVAEAGNEEITVSWTSKDQNASYRVYYGLESQKYDGKDSDLGTSPIEVAQAIKSLTITGLENGAKYYIVVTAVYEDTESSYSAEVSAIPEDPDNPNPKISLTQNSFDFYCEPGGSESQNLTISNSGGGVLEWQALEDATWLSVSPESGTNQTNITLMVNCAGLSDGFEDTANVEFSAPKSQPTSIPVNVHVSAASTPDLSVTSSVSYECEAGAVEELKGTFSVQNSGNSDPISFTASESASWLRINPTSGTTDAQVSVYVDCTGLSAPSNRTNQVTVTGNGETEYVTVNLSVVGGDDPDLDAPAQLNYSCTEGAIEQQKGTFEVTNIGNSDPINFTLSESASWLRLNPASGGTTNATIQVYIKCSNLVYPQEPSADITVNGNGETIYVTVNLDVEPQDTNPNLEIDKDQINLQCIEDTGWASMTNIAVTNNGTGGGIDFTTSENASWLEISPSGGTTDTTVAVRINCAGFTAGQSYSEDVDFTGSGQTETATVNLSVIADDPDPPEIAFSPALNDGISATCTQNSSTSASLVVLNNGGSELSWNASESAAWLNLTPASDYVAAGGSTTVNVEINCSGLPLGSHSENVVFVNNAGADKIYPISVNVEASVVGGLTAVGGLGVIDVSWDHVSGATQYKLYHSQYSFDAGDLNEVWVQSELVSTNSYSKGMNGNSERFFRVMVNQPVQSPLSPMASAVSLPGNILDFELIPTQTTITAEFYLYNGADYYKVEYRIEGTDVWNAQNLDHIGETWATQHLLVNSNIYPGNTYEVRITPGNESGYGNPSGIQTIDTPTMELLPPNPFSVSMTYEMNGTAKECFFTWTWSPDNIDMDHVIGFKFYFEGNGNGYWHEETHPNNVFEAQTSFFTKEGNTDTFRGYARAIYVGDLLGDKTETLSKSCINHPF